MLKSKLDLAEAEDKFFDLVEALETGSTDEFVIMRDGKPAARLIPVDDDTAVSADKAAE